ncbi:MAG: PQQ-dependent sugar dehydrogenase [Wenzhouxiangellaceae bacterium]|nr:PQQ-dependent sugar dehydrogenase [Wenzhouxiangellaceae bacterium]MBS3746358.1 PQQ-dependent sugar dehydrogenase [Wenzhouxiangellaceae bacterium]MBS3823719.1 PQQ-dependent sugar dehydrogenase [Wenzhouxiangellaceae bacterium]
MHRIQRLAMIAASAASAISTVFALTSGLASAQAYQIETVAGGLEYPWSIAWLPDETALITERAGRLRLLRGGKLLEEPVAGLPEVYAASQGGLFEALPDPDFADNQLVYISFAHGTPEANATRVIRARLEGMRLVDREVLFTATPPKDTPVHYGGRMTFLPDGTLLIGLGDGFDFREQAQLLDNHFGKIVRIDTDGSAPSDNPFVDTEGALPEIYSYGHRNVQGLLYDSETGIVWQHEHGPRGGDEINRIRPGENYGWPVATHGIDYSGALISPYESRPGMVDPELVWTPSIAPAGMTIYRGDLFPKWAGDLFVSALAGRHLRRIELIDRNPEQQQVMLAERDLRLRDVRAGPDGALYLLVDASDGKILRIRPGAD